MYGAKFKSIIFFLVQGKKQKEKNKEKTSTTFSNN